MAKAWSRNRLLFLILGDILIINLSFLLAYVFRFGFHIPPENFLPYARYFYLYTILYIMVCAIFGTYEEERDFHFLDHFLVVAPVILAFAATHLGLLFLLREFGFPRLTLIISYILLWFLSAGLRALDSSILRKTHKTPRVFLIGSKEEIDKFEELNKGSKFVEVAGWADKIEQLGEMLKRGGAEEILILSSGQFYSLFLEIFLQAKKNGLEVYLSPSLYDLLLGVPNFDRTGDFPLLRLGKKNSPVDQVLIRALDIFGSSLLLLLLSPLLLFASLGILITSPGPLFIRQERIGLNGSVFQVIKFRTMIRDAEKDTGPVFAQEDDPRVTPFGRILRLLRIDELPQLWNVLIGQMSLVGPRPERPVFVEQFKKEIPGYSLRFLVKPGMTGMAQIYGSYGTHPENKLRYDLLYIKNQSFLFNLRLLFLTFKLMLGRKGAR